jgi:lipoyl-dependent peroxiredoxin
MPPVAVAWATRFGAVVAHTAVILQTRAQHLTTLGAAHRENAMIEQRASVHWDGAGKSGTGSVSTGSGALQDHPYGFTSRFEGDRQGTNPEELLGAAHAACFTMAFAFACERAGVTTTSIDTTAHVRLAKQGDGFAIDRIALTLDATVPGIDEARFQQLAQGAKRSCPLSKALASVPEITLQARLRV